MHDSSSADDTVHVADSIDPWVADFDSDSLENRNADAALQLADEQSGHHSSDEEDD